MVHFVLGGSSLSVFLLAFGIHFNFTFLSKADNDKRNAHWQIDGFRCHPGRKKTKGALNLEPQKSNEPDDQWGHALKACKESLTLSPNLTIRLNLTIKLKRFPVQFASGSQSNNSQGLPIEYLSHVCASVRYCKCNRFGSTWNRLGQLKQPRRRCW